MWLAFNRHSRVVTRALLPLGRPLAPAPLPLRHYSPSPSPLCKDKPNNTTKGEPKKSRFLKLDENGNPVKEQKREKTPDEKQKLEAARKERETRKKETRLKQIEIQRKRDAS